MVNMNGAAGTDLVQRINTVFINTDLDTHLALIVSDVDTVFDLKKRLLLEHLLCFPDVGDIKISALKVKRGGHLYHLSDSMFVTKAFDGTSKSWFLFVEAAKVEGQSENRQLQKIDSSMQIERQTNGVDLSSKRLSVIDKSGYSLEKDHYVKSKPSAYLSVADKQQPNDFGKETERDAANAQDVPFPDAYSRPIENALVDHQKVSAAAKHNSLDPKPLEKSNDHAMNLEPLDGGNTRNEAKDVHDNAAPEGAQKTEVTEKRKRKPKRKTRSSDNHEPGKILRPSHPSVLASAVSTPEKVSSNPDKASTSMVASGNVEFDPPENAVPDEIESLGTGRENSDTKDKSIITAGYVTQNKDGANVQKNAKSAKETLEKKKQKIGEKHGKEDPMAGIVESMPNTNKAISMPEAFSPQSSLVHKDKVSNLDLNKLPSDHQEASGGLTTTSTVDKKKTRKKPSKDLNKPAAATTSSRDLVSGTRRLGALVEGEPDALVAAGSVVHADVVSESRASLRRETLDDSHTIAIAKEIERGEINVDDVGIGKGILNTANNLQTPDLACKRRKEANVDKVAGLGKEGEFSKKDDAETMANRDHGTYNTDEAKPAKSSNGHKKSKKAKNPEQGTAVTACAQRVEGPRTDISSAELFNPADGEKPIERGVKKVDDVGSGKATVNVAYNLPTANSASIGRKEANVDRVAGLGKEEEFPKKDDAGAMANKDDGTINAFEAKPAKSSKGQKKSKKAKNPDKDTLVTSCAQHVEGPKTGISSAETLKPVDGEKPIERDVENVDDVGIGKAILRAAGKLRTTDLATKRRREANVDEVSSLEKEGEFPVKDDAEAMANRDEGRINANEAKSAKSSKGKRKSKKAKNPDEGTLATSNVQHVEGPGTGISSAEPIKPVDSKETDSVIRSVLDSLQHNKEQEHLEKTEKKSRKKTGMRQTLNAVDAQGLVVEEHDAAHDAPMVSADNAKGTDSSFKPSENAKQSAEVANSSHGTILHKLNGNNEGKPSLEKEVVDVGDTFVSSQTECDAVDNVKIHDQGAIGTRVDKVEVKSRRKKKVPDLHPGGSVNGSQSSTKQIEKQGSGGKARPASSRTSQQPSEVKNDSLVSLSNNDLQGSSATEADGLQGSSAIEADGDASEKRDKNLKGPQVLNNGAC